MTDDVLFTNHINGERDEYQDIIQGSFVDTYEHLSYKHVMSLKWFNSFCPDAKFLLKCDDDTVVNTPRILRSITEEYDTYWQPKMSKENDLIYCRFMRSTQPVIRDTTSKWYVPPDVYAEESYPQYCSGYALFYAKNTVPKMLEAAQSLKYFWIEDVFVTGLARRKANLRAIDVRLTEFRYNPAMKLLMGSTSESKDYKETFILAVNFDSNQIRRLWKALLNVSADINFTTLQSN